LPLDVPLDDRNVPAPDVLWFAEPLPLDSLRAPRPPEIAVEVRSPSTWGYDIGPKRELYERHGVRELWLADTASRTLLVYSRTHGGAGFDRVTELGAGDSLTSPLLPGFKLAIDSVFPAS
jgi:Uma2 family endonuclease